MKIRVWKGYGETQYEGEIDENCCVEFTIGDAQVALNFEYDYCYAIVTKNDGSREWLAASGTLTKEKLMKILAHNYLYCEKCGDTALMCGSMSRGTVEGHDKFRCINCDHITTVPHKYYELNIAYKHVDFSYYYFMSCTELKEITKLLSWLYRFSNGWENVPAFGIRSVESVPEDQNIEVYLGCIDCILAHSKYTQGRYGDHKNSLLDHHIRSRSVRVDYSIIKEEQKHASNIDTDRTE